MFRTDVKLVCWTVRQNRIVHLAAASAMAHLLAWTFRTDASGCSDFAKNCMGFYVEAPEARPREKLLLWMTIQNEKNCTEDEDSAN